MILPTEWHKVFTRLERQVAGEPRDADGSDYRLTIFNVYCCAIPSDPDGNEWEFASSSLKR